MTDIQKEQIRRLRGEGVSYSKIADILDMPSNTVKSFCNRNKLNSILNNANVKNDEYGKACGQCGKLITQNGRHRPRKFCSAKCRRAWWKENEKTASSLYITLKCDYCGKEFKSRSSEAHKYCSRDCYFNARFRSETHE